METIQLLVPENAQEKLTKYLCLLWWKGLETQQHNQLLGGGGEGTRGLNAHCSFLCVDKSLIKGRRAYVGPWFERLQPTLHERLWWQELRWLVSLFQQPGSERDGLLPVFRWLNYFSLCSTRSQSRVPSTFRDTILLQLNHSRNTILSNSKTHSSWQSRLIVTVMLASQGSLSPGLSSHGPGDTGKTYFSDNPVALGTQTKSRDRQDHGANRTWSAHPRISCMYQKQDHGLAGVHLNPQIRLGL